MSQRPNREDHAELQYQSEHASARKTSSILPYLVILVAAAFLLLVMAYFMERRTAEGLHQSVNAIQSIDQLVEENRNLHTELDHVKAQLAEAQGQLTQTKAELTDVQGQLAQAQSELAALRSPEPSPAP